MLKIAVCDDEKNIRDYLTALVKEQNAECSITGYAAAEDYLADGEEFDLIFLDIELGSSASGMNGMELAERIRDSGFECQPVIIFVTGYESYVYDAFDVGAFQYLLKPVNKDKFADVFGRAIRQILSRQILSRQILSQQVLPERDLPQALWRKKVLTIQYDAGTVKTILLDHIYYMESQNHKIVIHFKDGQIAYYARMGDLEKELEGQFFRIHKGYLINLAYVDEYNRTEVTLTSGDRLMISKYKYKDFTKAYLRFMQ